MLTDVKWDAIQTFSQRLSCIEALVHSSQLGSSSCTASQSSSAIEEKASLCMQHIEEHLQALQQEGITVLPSEEPTTVLLPVAFSKSADPGYSDAVRLLYQSVSLFCDGYNRLPRMDECEGGEVPQRFVAKWLEELSVLEELQERHFAVLSEHNERSRRLSAKCQALLDGEKEWRKELETSIDSFPEYEIPSDASPEELEVWRRIAEESKNPMSNGKRNINDLQTLCLENQRRYHHARQRWAHLKHAHTQAVQSINEMLCEITLTLDRIEEGNDSSK